MIILKQAPKLKAKLNKVIIKEYPQLEDLEITPTKEEQKFKSTMYGYDNVSVKKVTADIDVNIKSENIKEGTSILGVAGSYAGIDTSDATATASDLLKDKTAYANGKKITGTIEYYDGSYVGTAEPSPKITNASYLFYRGARIEMFDVLIALCKDVTTIMYMFMNNSSLTSLNLNKLDTSNTTDMSYAFKSCSKLTDLDMSSCNAEKVTNLSDIFNGCKILKNLKFFKNLGKGYRSISNNYSNYRLDLSSCVELTHESLMNVINNLYDLNLTYNVATGGTLYRQSLVLGSTNIAKLTEEEIAIATNKGWNVT
mgnify:CR=1 FL=1